MTIYNWFSREKIIGLVLTLFGVVIVLQIVRFQTLKDYQDIADYNQIYEVETKTEKQPRGYIYDRWGHLLAGSQEVYEIGVDLLVPRDADTIAAVLSGNLGLDYNDLRAKSGQEYIPGGINYLILADFVSPEKANQIAALQKQYSQDDLDRPSLQGLHFRPHLSRIYPEGKLGSNILGYYNFLAIEGDRGWFGVEEKYNDTLTGKVFDNKYWVSPFKASENPVSLGRSSSLILTIDREIQAAMEDLIEEAVEKYDAASGTILVLDPSNGEVLAMVSLPQMDLNRYWEFGKTYEEGQLFNRTIGEPVEPGSVFKIITMAAALDSGVVTPSSTYLDTGINYVGGIPIYNWDRAAYGEQDMTGCLQHSLNVCLSALAEEMGATQFYEYLDRFGIGQRTYIDLAGEIVFPVRKPGDSDWYEIDLGTNSFGQGISITPIQLVTAVSAIANEGRMMQPHVVKAVIQDGQQIDIRPRMVSTPVSAETARALSDMLAISLENEASTALVDGYRVAGKTGTAQIPGNNGYLADQTNVSFIGWGPVDDPKFLVYIWLEKPATDQNWGSVIAAPIFSKAFKTLAILTNLPPDQIRQQATPSAIQANNSPGGD